MAYIHFAKSKGQSIESFRMVSARHNPPQEIDGLLAWAAGRPDVTTESYTHRDVAGKAVACAGLRLPWPRRRVYQRDLR